MKKHPLSFLLWVILISTYFNERQVTEAAAREDYRLYLYFIEFLWAVMLRV